MHNVEILEHPTCEWYKSILCQEKNQDNLGQILNIWLNKLSLWPKSRESKLDVHNTVCTEAKVSSNTNDTIFQNTVLEI